MQVISAGRIPVEPSEDIECNHCRSVLRYTKRDVRLVGTAAHPGAWITCPICQTTIDVTTE